MSLKESLRAASMKEARLAVRQARGELEPKDLEDLVRREFQRDDEALVMAVLDLNQGPMLPADRNPRRSFEHNVAVMLTKLFLQNVEAPAARISALLGGRVALIDWPDVVRILDQHEKGLLTSSGFLIRCHSSSEVPGESATERLIRDVELSYVKYTEDVERLGRSESDPEPMSRSRSITKVLERPTVSVNRYQTGPRRTPTDGSVEEFERLVERVRADLRAELDQLAVA